MVLLASNDPMSGNLKIFGAFLSGAALAVGCVMIWQPNQTHAREETKMAYVNREIAMERGDRGMQTYFVEVIAWNAHMHLSPRFFDGVSKIDWLDKEVEAPPYRRMKDGVSYAELRRLMRAEK